MVSVRAGKPFRSLRLKFLLPLLLGGIAVAVTGGWFTYRTTQSQLEQRLLGRSELLASVLNHAAMVAMSQFQVQHVVEAVMRESPEIERIVIVTSDDGKVLAASDPDWVGLPADQLPDLHLSEHFDSTNHHDGFARHFEASGEQFVYFTRLEPHISQHVGEHAARQGQAMAGAGASGMEHAGMSNASEMGPAMDDMGPMPSRDGAAPTSRGTILVQLNQKDTNLAISSILWQEILTLMAGVAMTMVLAYFVVDRSVLTPLERIRESMAQRRSGNMTARAPALSHDEIGDVAQTLNRMLDSLDEHQQALSDAKEQAEASGERYRALYKKTPVMLHSIDKGGRLVDVSDAWLEGLDYTREEVIGCKIVEFMTDDSREATENSQLPEFYRTGVLTNVPKQFVTRDGEVRDILLSAISERDQSGNFIRSLAVLNDVTERKKFEEKLWKSNAQLQAILDYSPAKIHIKDAEGRYTLINKRSEALFGVTDEEARGRTSREIFPQAVADAFTGHDQKVLDYGKPIEEEEEWHLEDGVHTYLTVKFPIHDASGKVSAVGAVGTDITERKQTEYLLQEAKKQAEVANRSKSEFLANMSHELRTPLNAVIGFSEIIMGGMFGPVGNAKYLEYANDINASGQHLLALINDILDLSKIEAGKLELYEQVVDVAGVLDASMTLVKERAEEAELSLEMHVSDGLPAIVADQIKVKQALINLLSNAVKFTRPGGTVSVHAYVESDGDLAIRVADTGVGIAAGDIPKVMEPFGQADNSLTRQHQGTGLGLPLSKALIELHEGTLELESELGVGTNVTIRFPAERVRDCAA